MEEIGTNKTTYLLRQTAHKLWDAGKESGRVKHICKGGLPRFRLIHQKFDCRSFAKSSLPCQLSVEDATEYPLGSLCTPYLRGLRI